jgi:hypothetical protein
VVEQLVAQDGSHAGHRLVEQDHSGLDHERTAELEELARDAGADEVPSSGEGQVVARLDAASPVSRGDEAELWVDASKLHLFDPSTGTHLARR